MRMFFVVVKNSRFDQPILHLKKELIKIWLIKLYPVPEINAAADGVKCPIL